MNYWLDTILNLIVCFTRGLAQYKNSIINDVYVTALKVHFICRQPSSLYEHPSLLFTSLVFIYLSVNSSIFLSIYLFTSLVFIYLLFYLSIYLSIYLFSLYLFICLLFYLSIYLSIYLLSLHLFICLLFYLSIYLSIYRFSLYLFTS